MSKIDLGAGECIGIGVNGDKFYVVSGCVYRVNKDGYGPFLVGTRREFDKKVGLGVYVLV